MTNATQPTTVPYNDIVALCEREYIRGAGDGYVVRSITQAATASDGGQSYVAVVCRWYKPFGGQDTVKEVRVMGFRRHTNGQWVNSFNMMA